MIKQKAANFPNPNGQAGTLKLIQQANNPDAFSLVYFSPLDYGGYAPGETYTSARFGVLARQQFDDYPEDGEPDHQIDGFFSELSSGKLVRSSLK